MKCSACGHRRDFHLHYRPGTECSICWCRQFSRPLWMTVRDRLRALRGRQ